MVCEGPIAGIRRVWLNGKLYYNRGLDADLKTRKDSLKFSQKYCRFYLGTPTQPTDAYLEAATDDVNAYRNRVIIVFENLPLADFGNQIPLVSVEVVKTGFIDSNNIVRVGPTFLAEPLTDLCLLSGLNPTQFNATRLSSFPITGFYLGESNKSYAGYIRDLAECYFLDIVESATKIQFFEQKRDGVDMVIPFDDMCCFEAGTSRPDNFKETRTQDLELPNEIICKALNPSLNYAEDTRKATKPSQLKNTKQFSFSAVMTATEIATWAYKRLFLDWIERITYKFKLPPKYLQIEAGDILEISPHGTAKKVKVTKVNIGANFMLELECRSYDPSIYDFIARVLPIYTEKVKPEPSPNNNQYLLKRQKIESILSVTNEAGTLTYTPTSDWTADLTLGRVERNPSGSIPANATLKITYETEEKDVPPGPIDVSGTSSLKLLDIPLIKDSDPEGGIYVSVGSSEGRWQPTTLYYSRDGGTSYTQAITINSPGIFGVCQNILPNWTNFGTNDNSSQLIVKLDIGSLASVPLAWSPYDWEMALVGNEIIRFRDATLNQDGTYTIKELQRGQRGTDHLMTGHVASEQFVMLSKEIHRLSGTFYDLGQTLQFKAVSGGILNESLSDVNALGITYAGNDLKPYGPADIVGVRNGAGDVTITAKRRDRKRGDATSPYNNLPNSETLTQFELEIMNGATVARTVTGLTSLSYVYTSAQQVTDFGANQPAITVRWYQMSGDVGRGFPGVKTV
jgi:hypothetical protein